MSGAVEFVGGQVVLPPTRHGQDAVAPEAPDHGDRDVEAADGSVAAPRRAGRYMWLAALLSLGLTAWMVSGALDGGEEGETLERAQALPRISVEVAASRETQVEETLVLDGAVKPVRETLVRPEVEGVIETLAVRKGAPVEAGDLIARVAPAERTARLGQAEAAVQRARRDFEAVDDLAARGFATRARLEEVRAALAEAEASLAQAEAGLDDLEIRAPVSGVVNTLALEAGQVVQTGDEVARIVDTTTLLVDLRVPQTQVRQVTPGMKAEVAFVTGEERTGAVVFVSANADPATRTFAVEVEVANADGAIPAGIGAEARLTVGETAAHFVSPAILTLGPDGRLGIKTVEAGDTVAFYPVELVRAETEGVWVSGLPAEARLITVGQGFVAAGDAVTVRTPVPPTRPGRPSSASVSLAPFRTVE